MAERGRDTGLSRFTVQRGTYLAVLIAVAHAVFLFASGPRLGADSTFYIETARALLTSGFDLEVLASPIAKPYALFIVVVAAIQGIFDEHWKTAFMLVQLGGLTACYWLAFRLLGRSGVSAWPQLVAAGLILVSFESLQWGAYVLTDALSLVSVFILFALLHSASVADRFSLRTALAIGAALLVASTIRPNYAPLGGLIVLSAVLSFLTSGGRGRVLPVSIRVYLSILLAALCAASAVGIWVLYRPEDWPAVIGRLVTHIRLGFLDGVVVDDRPGTYVSDPEGVLDYAGLLALRVGYFFALHAEGFSLKHTLLNVAVLGTSYALTLVAVVDSLRRRSVLNRAQANLVWLAVTLTLAFAFFHGLTVLDYDWRYRAPVVLPLAVSAAVGAQVLWAHVTRGYRASARSCPGPVPTTDRK